MKRTTIRASVAVALLLSGMAAEAQVSPVRPQYRFPSTPADSEWGAAGVDLGSGVYLYPYLNFAAGNDDNLFFAPDNTKSSNLYIVTPGLKLQTRGNNAVFGLTYEANIGRYLESNADNYVDQNTVVSVDVAMNSRNFLRVAGDYLLGHDARGSTDTPSGQYPNKYRLTGVGALYALGASGAQGRLEAGYAMAEKRYTNNTSLTASQNRDTDQYGAAFYWRAFPKTYLIAEARFNNYDYIQPTTPGDSRESRYYAGVTWEATAATTGTVKIGKFEKRFDSGSGVPTINESSWEALVTWSPLSYSKFDLYSSKQPTESTGLGDAIIVKATGLLWTHGWNSQVSSTVGYKFENDEYVGFPRSDDINTIALGVKYKMRRWLNLGAEYSYTDRSSNIPQFDYKRNLILFTLGGTL
jgi:hypothetical protein